MLDSFGSDQQEHEEGVVIFRERDGRKSSLFVLLANQKKDLLAACNVQKSCQRELLNVIVFDPYNKDRRCFYACLKHLELKHDVKPKQ